MNSLIINEHRPANVVAFAFLFLAFLTGVISAFQIPTLSLYLTQEVKAIPMAVGIFYAVNALVAILVSQWIATISDRSSDRRKIIMFCCFTAIFGCLIFAYIREYYLLIFFGTLLVGIGGSANPQIFAFAREYADSTKREAVMFTTILRTQISLAWIVGPPLSFFIALTWGFDFMYLVSAVAFLLCGLIVITLLPKLTIKQTVVTQQIIQAPRSNRKSTTYLFIACILMWTCNSMYLINMPLYVIHELQLSNRLAGILMGTAAGLEIPIMLIAGYCTRFWSKKQLMTISLFSGFIFYIMLFFSHTPWQLLVAQIFNAVFIGIIATIGMLYFQDLMPKQMGHATTLYLNSARGSWVIGGPLAGFIAQIWHYESVFYVSLILLTVGIFCLLKVKSI